MDHSIKLILVHPMIGTKSMCQDVNPLVPEKTKGFVVLFRVALRNARLGDINLEFVLSQGIIVEHADRLVCIFL